MISRWWNYFKAAFHLDDTAVCKMSEGRGVADFHDYEDSETPYPMHFHEYNCKRCGKSFII